MLFVLFDDRDDVLFLFKHVKKKRSQGVMQPTDRNWRILGHRLLQKKKKKKKVLYSLELNITASKVLLVCYSSLNTNPVNHF